MINIKILQKILLFIIIIFLIFTYPNLSQNTIELRETHYKGTKVNIIKVNRNKNRVVILSSEEELNKKPVSESFIYSVRNLNRILSPVAMINGGFTGSFTFPIPTGLIVHNKRTISSINRADSFLQGGVFCIKNSQKNGVDIIKSSDYKENTCFEALQNGPLIIKDGRNNISRFINRVNRRFVNTPYSRSIVAIDKNKDILLIQTDSISLNELVNFLINNLSVISALNLSGHTDSGMIYNSKSFGKIDSTVPSVIAVFSR